MKVIVRVWLMVPLLPISHQRYLLRACSVRFPLAINISNACMIDVCIDVLGRSSAAGAVGEVGAGGMYGLLQIIRRETQPFTVTAKESTQLLCLSHVYFTEADFAGVRRSRASLSRGGTDASPTESTASTPMSRRSAPEVVVTQSHSGWVQYHFGEAAPMLTDLTSA